MPVQTRQAGLEGTGKIDPWALVKEALRMRPTRLMIGEVRGAECLDLLLALNTGLPAFGRKRDTRPAWPATRPSPPGSAATRPGSPSPRLSRPLD